MTKRLQSGRKIKNREELKVLRRNCEDVFMTIEQLGESKTTKIMSVPGIIGILGTVFMFCSLFLYLAGMIKLHVFLAIIGFVGWGVSYYLHIKVRKESTRVAVEL